MLLNLIMFTRLIWATKLQSEKRPEVVCLRAPGSQRYIWVKSGSLTIHYQNRAI